MHAAKATQKICAFRTASIGELLACFTYQSFGQSHLWSGIPNKKKKKKKKREFAHPLKRTSWKHGKAPTNSTCLQAPAWRGGCELEANSSGFVEPSSKPSWTPAYVRDMSALALY
jgi:hypothetical protein